MSKTIDILEAPEKIIELNGKKYRELTAIQAQKAKQLATKNGVLDIETMNFLIEQFTRVY